MRSQHRGKTAPSARPVVSAGAARRQVGSPCPSPRRIQAARACARWHFRAVSPPRGRTRAPPWVRGRLTAALRHESFSKKTASRQIDVSGVRLFFLFFIFPIWSGEHSFQGLNGRFFPLFLIFLLSKLQPGRQQRALRTTHMPARGKAARALRQSPLQKCSFGCVFWKSKIYLIICGVLPIPP